jgi:pyruvate,orthophosphate dikinase
VCGLAICYPELIDMQARAIFQAVLEAGEKTGEKVVPEIMVPLVAYERELKFIKDRIDIVAEAVMKEWDTKIEYLVGTMIELPRAAIRADKIAESSEFFSFGTNDLTQSTFGISRDDAGLYLNEYLRKGVIDRDPFITIDVDGVGEFMQMAAERGQKTRPDITLGICGEHGGDPASIAFLRNDRPALRVVLALPRACGAAGRGAGDARHARAAIATGRLAGARAELA